MNKVSKRSLIIISIFFLVSIGSTLFAWKITTDVVTYEANQLFLKEVSDIEIWIKERFNLYATAMYGLQAFWEASDEVTRAEWSTYVKNLRLTERYPGVSSIIYIEKVDKKDKDSFIRKVRNDKSIPDLNLSNFTFQPDEEKDTYFVVNYIEPLSGRENAFGIDFGREEKRLKALIEAQDTGKLTTTGRITLTTTEQPGFGILIPLYKNQDLEGFATTIFRGNEVFNQIFGLEDPFPDLDFEIYDGGESEENLLHDHDPKQLIINSGFSPKLATKRTLALNGSDWILHVAAKPSFSLTKSQQQLPSIVLISGLTFSLGIFGLFLHRLLKYRSTVRG